MLPLTVVGVSKPGADKNHILFALDVARDVWINAQIALVETSRLWETRNAARTCLRRERLACATPATPA